jgi:hypothetical protein
MGSSNRDPRKVARRKVEMLKQKKVEKKYPRRISRILEFVLSWEQPIGLTMPLGIIIGCVWSVSFTMSEWNEELALLSWAGYIEGWVFLLGSALPAFLLSIPLIVIGMGVMKGVGAWYAKWVVWTRIMQRNYHSSWVEYDLHYAARWVGGSDENVKKSLADFWTLYTIARLLDPSGSKLCHEKFDGYGSCDGSRCIVTLKGGK